MFTFPKNCTMYTILFEEREVSICLSSVLQAAVPTCDATCLPSLRHRDGEVLGSSGAGCWEAAGPSFRAGFSILSSRRGLTRGRYTVPS